MESITIEELAKVPYLHPTSDGRMVKFSPLWDGEKWHYWIFGPSGLLPVAIVDCEESGYFATTPAREHDLFFPFLNFMWKHASWPPLVRWLSAIEDDIARLCASLAKVEHFDRIPVESTPGHRLSTHLFVTTEIEYLYMKCRSVFDNLQRIIAAIWESVRLKDPEAQKAKRKLPESFRGAAAKARAWKSGDSAPFGLPLSLIETYRAMCPFFFDLRDIRDKVAHRGGSVGTVYRTETGHGVRRDGKLAGMTPILREEHSYNEVVVSLRPILANLVRSTLDACNQFARAFTEVIGFGESMMPRHLYYLRTPHSHALAAALQLIMETRADRPIETRSDKANDSTESPDLDVLRKLDHDECNDLNNDDEEGEGGV